MKNKFIFKILGVFLLLVTSVVTFLHAETPPVPGGGAGGVGPGAQPTTPIDMYQIFLLGLALFMIIYFYKKIKLSKV